MHFKSRINENRLILIIVLLLFACIYGLCFLFLGNYFIVSDDLTMLAIMNGSYTGVPDAHLIHIMYPLGYFFKTFYSFFPNFYWYEFFVLGSHFFCISVCIVHFIRIFSIAESYQNEESKINNKRLRIIKSLICLAFLLLMICADIRFYFENQFTLTSCLFIISSLFIASTFDYLPSKSGKIRDVILVIICFSLSFWIRKEVCFMAIPLFIFIFLTKVILNGKNNIIYSIIIFLSAGLIVLVSYAIHNNAFNSEEWNYFEEYNKARVEIFDYDLVPQYNSNEEFYGSIGIDEYEYNAILKHNLNLVDELDSEKLSAISNRQKGILKDWEQYYSVRNKIIKDTLKSLFRNHTSVLGILTCFVYLLGVVISLFIENKKKKVLLLVSTILTIGYEISFIGLFKYLGRLPDRLLYSVDLVCIFTVLSGIMICLTDIWIKLKKQRKSFIAVILINVILGVILTITFIQLNQLKNSYLPRMDLQNKIWAYIENDRENVYYVDYDICGRYCVLILGEHHIEPNNCKAMIDWAYKSPLEKRKNDIYNLSGDSTDLIQENVYLMLNDYVDIEYIRRILENNTDKEIDIKLIDSFDGIQVYKCITME